MLSTQPWELCDFVWMSAIGYEVGQVQLTIPTGVLMSLRTFVPMMIIIIISSIYVLH